MMKRPGKFDYYDIDGTVLRDSETIAMDIAARTLSAAAGHPSLGYEHFVDQAGKSVHLMMTDAHKSHGTTFGHPTLEKAIEIIEPENHRRTLAALKAGAHVAPDFVDYLKHRQDQGYTAVAVTGSRFDRVSAGLEAAGVKQFFPDELIFSAPVRIGELLSKPQPWIYLHAAHSVGGLEVDYTGLKAPEKKLLTELLENPRAHEHRKDAREFTGLAAQLVMNHTRFPADARTAEDSGSGVEAAKKAGIPHIFGYMGGTHVVGKEEKHGAMLQQRGGAGIILVRSWQEVQAYAAPSNGSGPVRPVSRSMEAPLSLRA